MSKKKTTGLSKKVPAIFQGLPDIEVRPPIQGEAPLQSASPEPERARSAHSQPSGGRLLFEVSEYGAKMMVTRRRHNGFEIMQVAKCEPPQGIKGKIRMEREMLAEWLKEAVRDYVHHGMPEARLLLTHTKNFVAEVEKPEAEAKDLRDAVIWQIADSLPFPVEKAEVRYELRDTRLMAAAVETEYLGLVIDVFHEAGIYPELVTLLPFAYQAFYERYDVFGRGVVMVVHMAGHQTSFFTFREGKLKALREIALGGEQVTQAMMGTLVVNETQVTVGYEEAKVLKESLGLPTSQLMPDPEEPKRSQLSSRIRPIFEKLTTELKNSIGKIQRDFPGESLKGIFLAGGASQMKGIDDYFASALGVPVQPIPVAKIDPLLDLSSAGLLGLAQMSSNRFNFASLEDLWKPRFDFYRMCLKKGCAILLGLMFVFALGLGFQIFMKQRAFKAEQKIFLEMGASDEKLAALDTVLSNIAIARDLRQREIGAQPRLGNVLRELSHLVPSAMVIQTMHYRKQPKPLMVLGGTVEAGGRPPDLVLSGFLEKLNRSNSFRHSHLDSRSEISGGHAQEARFSVSVEVARSGEVLP